MGNSKTILGYVLVAIIFAVGGYFIGTAHATKNQEALLFKAGTITPAGEAAFQWDLENCWRWDSGTVGSGTAALVAPRFCAQVMQKNTSPAIKATGQVSQTSTKQ